MESSPLGTGDFAVNAGFAALTLDPNDAKALASPLTPAERRSVVAALAHRGDRSSWLDGGDEGGGADASPAFSPAVAAVVAKAVAGKILTLEEKGALQSAMEAQEKRRRARARRAELEDAEPARDFAFPVAVSPYDPKTPTSGFGSVASKRYANENAVDSSAVSFRYPAMTDDNTPSTGRTDGLNAVLTPLTNASSVPSLPSNSSLKEDVDRNPVRRAMAAAARGDRLTPESAAAVAAVDGCGTGRWSASRASRRSRRWEAYARAWWARTHDRGWRARKTRKTLNQTRKTINQKALNQKASGARWARERRRCRATTATR